MSTRARGFRIQHFPDKKAGMTTFNSSIRGGNAPVSVADRACVILEAVVGRDHPDLSMMRDVAYLSACLAVVDPTVITEAGFADPVLLDAFHIQGHAWDTHFGYHRRLIEGFPTAKLVKGALHIAEVEHLSGTPGRWRNKAIGEIPTVRRILVTTRFEIRMLVLLDALAEF